MRSREGLAPAHRRCLPSGLPVLSTLRIGHRLSAETETRRDPASGSPASRQPAVPEGRERPPAPRRPNQTMQLAWLAAMIGLGGLAYRHLVLFEPGAGFSNELQAWLLTPSDTAPSVVLVLTAWLLWRRAGLLARLPRRGGPAALTAALLAAGLGVLAWATYTGAPDLLVPSLVATLLGLGSLLWGTAGIRVLKLPVAFLIFAMPIPAPLLNQVVFRFQIWTADISGWLLFLLGVPAYVSGDQILRADSTFTIVEGCSGLRTVETLTMLTVLMVDLFRRGGLHAWLLVLAAPFVAFAVNSLRAIFLILMPLAETVTIHNLQGIAMLLLGLVLLYLLDGALERVLPARDRTPTAHPGSASRARSVPAPWVAVGVLLAAVGTSYAVPRWDPLRPPSAPLELSVPRELDGWRAVADLETDRVFLGRVGFDESIERRYRKGRQTVDLFVGIADPADRLTDPFSPKTLRPGSGWVVEEAGVATVGPEGRQVDTRLLRAGSRRVLVYHWTEGTAGPADELLRHLLALDSSPLRREREGVVVRLTTELGQSENDGFPRATRRLEGFATAVWPSVAPLGSGGR